MKSSNDSPIDCHWLPLQQFLSFEFLDVAKGKKPWRSLVQLSQFGKPVTWATSRRGNVEGRWCNFRWGRARDMKSSVWAGWRFGDFGQLCHCANHIWLVVWNMIFIWFYDFPYIGNNHPNWLIFFRGVETTNQIYFDVFWLLVGPTCSKGHLYTFV